MNQSALWQVKQEEYILEENTSLLDLNDKKILI